MKLYSIKKGDSYVKLVYNIHNSIECYYSKTPNHFFESLFELKEILEKYISEYNTFVCTYPGYDLKEINKSEFSIYEVNIEEKLIKQ